MILRALRGWLMRKPEPVFPSGISFSWDPQAKVGPLKCFFLNHDGIYETDGETVRKITDSPLVLSEVGDE